MRQNTRRPIARATDARTRPIADPIARPSHTDAADGDVPLVLLGPGGTYCYAVEGGSDVAASLTSPAERGGNAAPTPSSWSLEFLVSLTELARTTAIFTLRMVAFALATFATGALDLLHRGAARVADITSRAAASGPEPAFATGYASVERPSTPTTRSPRNGTPSNGPSNAHTNPTSVGAACTVDAVSHELRRAMETLRPPLFGVLSSSRRSAASTRAGRSAAATSSSTRTATARLHATGASPASLFTSADLRDTRP
jgi:hypothetical protein